MPFLDPFTSSNYMRRPKGRGNGPDTSPPATPPAVPATRLERSPPPPPRPSPPEALLDGLLTSMGLLTEMGLDVLTSGKVDGRKN
eukprot:scaffold125417_cov13-Tisochrysis_lutea.AAC.1